MSLDLTDLFDLKRDVSAYDAVQNDAQDAVEQRREADEAANAANLTELQRDGEAAKNAGVQTDARGAFGNADRDSRAEEEKKKRNDAVDRAQLLLERIRADLEQELIQIDIRMGEIEQMKAGVEDVFANGYDVGADGKITNEQAEKALREYEKRTGQKVDRDDEAAVMAALHDQWEEFEREEREMNHRAREIEDFKNGPLRTAEAAQNDPNLSQEQKDEIAKETVDQGIEHGVIGVDVLETYDTQIDSGHKPDVTKSVEVIVEERDMILGGI